MLLPPADAAHFLSAYRAMLAESANRSLDGVADFIAARDAFFENAELSKAPPTADARLLKALPTAIYGKYVMGRHMARGTEMVGPEDQIFKVRGITSELRDFVEPWQLVRTTVMYFAGYWICDGLIVSYKFHIGPNMRKGFLAKIRAAKS